MNRNGYRPSHRNRFLLIEHKVLTREEFVVFEYCLDQMGFDKKNEWFGKIYVNFQEIALVLNYSANPPYNSIREKIKKLIKLNILIPTNKANIYSIFNADRYVATTNLWKGKSRQFQQQEHNKPFSLVIQNIAQNFQYGEAKVQKNEQNIPSKLKIDSSRALSTSKVNNLTTDVSIDSRNKDQRTLADYQRIYRKKDWGDFTIDDMKWLDDHYDAQRRYVS